MAHGYPWLCARPDSDAALNMLGVGFRCSHVGSHGLQRVYDLGNLFLNVAVLSNADSLGDTMSYPQHELQLCDVLHRNLLHVLPPDRRLGNDLIGQLYVVEGENPLPGYEDVIEYGQTVHLVELS